MWNVGSPARQVPRPREPNRSLRTACWRSFELVHVARDIPRHEPLLESRTKSHARSHTRDVFTERFAELRESSFEKASRKPPMSAAVREARSRSAFSPRCVLNRSKTPAYRLTVVGAASTRFVSSHVAHQSRTERLGMFSRLDAENTSATPPRDDFPRRIRRQRAFASDARGFLPRPADSVRLLFVRAAGGFEASSSLTAFRVPSREAAKPVRLARLFMDGCMLIRFVDKSVLGSAIPRWIVLCHILICRATG